LHAGWESTQAQAKFQATPDFEEVMSALKPILTGNPTVYFIEFKPYAPKEGKCYFALGSATFWGPSS